MNCFILGLLLTLPVFSFADDAVLNKPVVSTRYNGGFPNDFPAELSQVQTLLQTAPPDISSQLGVTQYLNGFHHPVSVHFDDGVPAVNENAFFYLEPSDPTKPFAQSLKVNVEAFARQQARPGWTEDTLRNAFYYTTAKLIFNDAVGNDEDLALPVWAQEGAAVYVSGMGDTFVKNAAAKVSLSHVSELADDLNRPLPFVTQKDYARYYLAIKYMVDTGGMSSFQTFMRNLLANKSAADAVRDVFAQEWPVFERHVKEYSVKEFSKYAAADADIQSTTYPQRHTY
jgi:hypothetical protein